MVCGRALGPRRSEKRQKSEPEINKKSVRQGESKGVRGVLRRVTVQRQHACFDALSFFFLLPGCKLNAGVSHRRHTFFASKSLLGNANHVTSPCQVSTISNKNTARADMFFMFLDDSHRSR